MRRLLAVALTLTLVPSAAAATKHGITPTSPVKGATVKAGSRPTFKGRVSGRGPVFVSVSRSPRRDKKGVIKSDATTMLQQAKVVEGRFSARARFFDFPEFWLNQPGTYYWQAVRSACPKHGTRDCSQEGPVVRFKVG